MSNARKKATRQKRDEQKLLASTLQPGDQFRERTGWPWPVQLALQAVGGLAVLVALVVGVKTLFRSATTAEEMQALEAVADHLKARMEDTRTPSTLRALEAEYEETIAKIGEIRERMSLDERRAPETSGPGRAWPLEEVPGGQASAAPAPTRPEPVPAPAPDRALPPGAYAEARSSPQRQESAAGDALVRPDPRSGVGSPGAVANDDAGTEAEACVELRSAWQHGAIFRLVLSTPAQDAELCAAARRRHEALARELQRLLPGN